MIPSKVPLAGKAAWTLETEHTSEREEAVEELELELEDVEEEARGAAETTAKAAALSNDFCKVNMERRRFSTKRL